MAMPLVWLGLSIPPLLPERLSSNAFPLLTAPDSQRPGNNEPLGSRLVTGALAVRHVCPDGLLGRVAGRQQRCRSLHAPYHDARHVASTPIDTILVCTHLVGARCRSTEESAQTSCAKPMWGYSVSRTRGRAQLPFRAYLDRPRTMYHALESSHHRTTRHITI